MRLRLTFKDGSRNSHGRLKTHIAAAVGRGAIGGLAVVANSLTDAGLTVAGSEEQLAELLVEIEGRGIRFTKEII